MAFALRRRGGRHDAAHGIEYYETEDSDGDGKIRMEPTPQTRWR